jgi:hypothetical protein
MSTIKRLRAPLVMMFGATVASIAFAMPASAAEGVYPPPAGTDVLGTSATTNTPVAAAGASASTADQGLAFTGGAVVGVGALGGLLLVGGATMVVAGRRRKVDA